MSIIAVFLFFSFSAYLVTRFGNQVLARDSTSWWLILLFIGVGVLAPDSYRVVSDFLGITLVSNFVFAILILFLLKVTLEGAIRSTQVLRKLRDVVTTEAALKFSHNAKFSGELSNARILIMLPTYNEEENIGLMTGALNKHLPELGRDWLVTLCFVNDGSLDNTKNELERLVPDSYVSHLSNFGVSGVLLTGFKAALELGCDFVVQCDADGQHPVDTIGELLAAAKNSNADLTIGSRFFSISDSSSQSYRASTTLARRTGSLLISYGLRSFGNRARVTDPTSGFRVYSKAAMQFLIRQMPDDYPEPESIALCALKKLKIREVPINMYQRQAGDSSITGSKSIEFMLKVFTALVSLRLRYAIGGRRLGR